MMTDKIIGVVQNAIFRPLDPSSSLSDTVRLTTIQMQASVPPESGEIDLTPYEGRAIMIRGHDGGGWIYFAEVIDEAGSILTAVVQRVFGQTGNTT